VTATVTGVYPAFNYPGYVAWDGTNIWVTEAYGTTVTKINPLTNTVAANITVGSSPRGVAWDGTNIWVANLQSNTVSRIRP
jgi:YVTN family beta-propeller protein